MARGGCNNLWGYCIRSWEHWGEWQRGTGEAGSQTCGHLWPG